MAVKKVFYRAPHNYDYEEASNEAAVKDFGPSLTVQSMAEEVDINLIMHRFGITGRMPDNPVVPMYGDFTNVKDFRSALDAVRFAQAGFDELPANVRARFYNDPQKLLEFCEEPSNREEGVRLGLFKEPQATTSQVVQTPASGVPGSSGAGGSSGVSGAPAVT